MSVRFINSDTRVLEKHQPVSSAAPRADVRHLRRRTRLPGPASRTRLPARNPRSGSTSLSPSRSQRARPHANSKAMSQPQLRRNLPFLSHFLPWPQHGHSRQPLILLTSESRAQALRTPRSQVSTLQVGGQDGSRSLVELPGPKPLSGDSAPLPGPPGPGVHGLPSFHTSSCLSFITLWAGGAAIPTHRPEVGDPGTERTPCLSGSSSRPRHLS